MSGSSNDVELAEEPGMLLEEPGVHRLKAGALLGAITCMIRHYAALRAQVTEGHPT